MQPSALRRAYLCRQTWSCDASFHNCAQRHLNGRLSSNFFFFVATHKEWYMKKAQHFQATRNSHVTLVPCIHPASNVRLNAVVWRRAAVADAAVCGTPYHNRRIPHIARKGRNPFTIISTPPHKYLCSVGQICNRISERMAGRLVNEFRKHFIPPGKQQTHWFPGHMAKGEENPWLGCAVCSCIQRVIFSCKPLSCANYLIHFPPLPALQINRWALPLKYKKAAAISSFALRFMKLAQSIAAPKNT